MRRIANLHWFTHARVELDTTYAPPDGECRAFLASGSDPTVLYI